MTDFNEINEAWWEWYYHDENGIKRNQTTKERKEFYNELEKENFKFIFKGKSWKRLSVRYASNSGKTNDKTIIFQSEDGEEISKESFFKNNRKNSFLDRDNS